MSKNESFPVGLADIARAIADKHCKGKKAADALYTDIRNALWDAHARGEAAKADVPFFPKRERDAEFEEVYGRHPSEGGIFTNRKLSR